MSARAGREVVVTGLGVVTPVGNTVGEFMESLYAGRSGAGRIARFDPCELPTRIACEVKGVTGEYRDIKITFALLAARQAVGQAFGAGHRFDAGTRAGVSVGLGLELFSMDDLIASREPGFREPSSRRERLTFLNTPSDLCVHLIGREYSLNQPPMIHISACAASTDAIGAAFEAVRSGRWTVALAGGADSMINPMGVGGFCRIGAMTQMNDAPTEASRPFDRSRDGFVLGEGAGFLVLEDAEHARARGARVLARVSGYGNSLDAHSVSDPHPEALGAELAMRRALASAGLGPDDIDAVSAHGTGTPKNDPVESLAIRKVLGARAEKVPVNSTKSMIGHLISAAGAVETVAVVESIRRGLWHPTANLREVADDCRLRHVTGGPLEVRPRHVLKNSFGFGGQNACVVISAPGEPRG